jgi:HNH endonuclease
VRKGSKWIWKNRTERICIDCGDKYLPTGTTQKRCPICRKIHDQSLVSKWEKENKDHHNELQVRNYHKDLAKSRTRGLKDYYSRRDIAIYPYRDIMAQMIGRPLFDEEVVHHIDFDQENNDPSNLLLFPNQAEHARYHAMLRYGGSYERSTSNWVRF